MAYKPFTVCLTVNSLVSLALHREDANWPETMGGGMPVDADV
jgi:hypothetical protein